MTMLEPSKVKSTEEQYQEDLKLERTDVGYVLYYDDEVKRYVNATMELFGNSAAIKTYTRTGELWKGSRTTTVLSSNERPMMYQLLSVEDGLSIIAMGHMVKVDAEAYLKIRTHYQLLNSRLEPMYKQEREIVLGLVDELLNDDTLVVMLNSFIKEMPGDLFADPRVITQVEAFLAYAYQWPPGESLFWSDELQRATYAKVNRRVVGDKVMQSMVFDNEELVRAYFRDGLDLVSEIIREQRDLDKKQTMHALYHAINRLNRDTLATAWSNEYGSHLDCNEVKGLDQAVEVYLSIDTINHGLIQYAGPFICYLMENKVFSENANYLSCFNEFYKVYQVALKRQKSKTLKSRLAQKTTIKKRVILIHDVDLMNGFEFERCIVALFSCMGYDAALTKQGADQGIDLIAERDGLRIGIQAKCYVGTVGNSAVQEAAAGIRYYNLDKAIVITNSFFSESAASLARANNVILWDRTILSEKLLATLVEGT
ncbi:MAG: restriction endonuclease [Firmicutes bacterium]|nr:restriction endonuclease [Dethiobacter sp.]MBS3889804.1 restriction endonuclease [Bacillota bacterium]MBS4054989.1 restriction endonuclease [Thermaerobacter sp.]